MTISITALQHLTLPITPTAHQWQASKRLWWWRRDHFQTTTFLPLQVLCLKCPLCKYTFARVSAVWRSCFGWTIDKGALVCGKGNHCTGAWVARVRVSAHTVWMWSSFPLLRKLQMNHMLLPLRRFQMHHSLLMRHHSSQMQSCSFQTSYRNPKRRMSLAVGRTLRYWKSGVLSTSLGVRCQQRSPVSEWWRVVAGAGVEVGWCRHIGGIGTAGTADTAGTDASADSTLYKICSQKNMTITKHSLVWNAALQAKSLKVSLCWRECVPSHWIHPLRGICSGRRLFGSSTRRRQQRPAFGSGLSKWARNRVR